MERQYKVEMTITVNDTDLETGKTVDDLVLESLEEAPFQVNTITTVSEKLNREDIRNKAINDFKIEVQDAMSK